jgi:outer membrane protein
MGTRWSMEFATGSNTQFRASGEGSYPVGLQPLTWTFKYNFQPEQYAHTYIGFGGHYTFVTGALSLDSSSAGVAVQAGLDVLLSRDWVLNADFRYLGLEFKDTGTGAPRQLRIDPFLLSLGVSYRFPSFH